MRCLVSALLALCLGACVVGGGPQLVITRDRVRIGAQAGAGFGTTTREDSTAFRADLGFIAGRGVRPLAAVTTLFHRHDGWDGPGGGGAVSMGWGSGFLLAGGVSGGRFDVARCSGGDAWTVTIAARVIGDERQLVVWPQYVTWDDPGCSGGM